MGRVRAQQKALALQLARAGFPAARGEAREMIQAAWGDPAVWRCWASRRLDGEPLEWLIGFTVFMGHRVRVERGVYVPRPQTEFIAQQAVDALPADGVAADLCTGSGAVAVALRNARADARVVATDIDPNACRCAAKNGVEVYRGHLADPIPTELIGCFDVVVAVVPYVPTDEIIFLPRDVRKYEPAAALDGGANGIELLEQAVSASARLLRTGGSLLLELGGSQDEQLAPALQAAGFDLVARLLDGEGDLRGVHARIASPELPW
ncbi:MAG TPA: HemK family protein methyltransferase [Pseudonocardiaceae bacterium]|nr:HemK family protein methyltransferase [Pseudonocardiaceae bacterium]